MTELQSDHRVAGSIRVPPPPTEADERGWGLPWRSGGQASIVWQRHWHPRVLCLGDFRLCDPSQGKGRQKWKLQLAHKVTLSVFLAFLVFCGFRLDPLPVLDCMSVIQPRDSKIYFIISKNGIFKSKINGIM